jgi:hypothetical protein
MRILSLFGPAPAAEDAEPCGHCRPAAATSAWLVVEVATFASKNSLRVEERYMFPARALFLLALAAWLGRGAPPTPDTLVAAAVPAALLLALPLTRLLNVSITSDTFRLIPLYRLSNVFSGGGDRRGDSAS